MVFDTMVVAYAVLGVEEYAAECQSAFARAEEVVVPDFLRAELVNVVWQWVMRRRLPVDAGLQALRDGEDLLTRVVASEKLWEPALELAAAYKHPAYDMLFVALALKTGSRLLTYDRRLQMLFPGQALSVPDFLHGG